MFCNCLYYVLLFLIKAAVLSKKNGQVAMMQPAMAMLFNQSNLVRQFRHNLFQEFQVEEIVNLSGASQFC